MKGRATTSRAGAKAPINRSFERELASLESMSGHAPDPAETEQLQRILGHANNYLVAKAARLVADNQRTELLPMLGACFSALLRLEYPDRSSTIKLVSEFLDEGEESAAEAAFALAETHSPLALEVLIERRKKGTDAWFSSVLDNAIALTRLEKGLRFLLGIIEEDVRQPLSALEAISRVYQSDEVRQRASAAVVSGKNERVQVLFRQLFPDLL